ncbi:hypothetical protein [Butyrivibrio sp. NC3005]|uniref:hypothetical protein n=1 Tax=Butyrivibrio sp. NC3005 TaxID=1280685 RepID=UPI00040BD2BF|nr:hypothetical protein [Butyrivibrio sp. NC3005]
MKWHAPVMEELNINAPANGMAPDENFDGDWVEINGRWYRPGNGSISGSETAH